MAARSVIFEDVFRRADKDETGTLSPEEFHSAFSDGVLSHDDLSRLFDVVDRDGNATLDIEELSQFFAQSGQEFDGLFAGIEDLNGAAGKTLTQIRKAYSSSDTVHKFRMRFYVREAAHQLRAISNLLDSSHEMLLREAAADERQANAAVASARETVSKELAPHLLSGRGGRRRSSVASASAPVADGKLDAIHAEIQELRRDLRAAMARRVEPRVISEAESAAREHLDGDESEEEDSDEGPAYTDPRDGGEVGEDDEDDYGSSDADLLVAIANANRRGHLPSRARPYLKQALLSGRMSDEAKLSLAAYNETGDRRYIVDAMTL